MPPAADPDFDALLGGSPTTSEMESAPAPLAPASSSSDGSIPDPDFAALLSSAGPSTHAPAPSRAPAKPHIQTRFQMAASPSVPNEPEPSWSDVGSQALHNAIPSALGVGQSLLDAVAHPIKTAENVGQVGAGVLSQAQGALGVQQDPAQKTKTEALAKALEDHYSQTYGSVKGFKKAVATDPASVAMDASTLLGGAGAAADAAGLAKTAGVLSKVGSAVDPVANAVRVASAPAKLVSNPVTRAIQGVTTNVPTSLLKVAKEAGETTDPALRDAFLRHYNGQGSAGEYLQTAQKALAQVKQEASDKYLTGKSALADTPVDFAGTYGALDDADKELGMGAAAGFPAAKKAVADARDLLDSVSTNPDPTARNIVNADALKQQIWDLRDSMSNNKAQQYLGKVYNAVKGDISKTDPGYQNLMESYQDGLNNITDITKTFGLGRNPAASGVLAKGLRALKKQSGDDILTQLSKAEPTLPYMMAGSALSPWTAGGARNALEAGVTFPWAIAMHNPAPLIAQAVVQSPKAAGALNYASGAVKRVGTKAASSPLAKGAYYAGRADEEPASDQPAPAAPAVPSDATGIFGKMLHLESRNKQFDKDGNVIVSPKGAIGAAQIMPRTGPEAAKLAGLPWDPNRLATDPDYNRALGQAYHAHLSQLFGDPIKGAAAYNAGPGAFRAALASAEQAGEPWLKYLPTETQNYVQSLQTAAATGGRITRAMGGKTERPTHEQLVERLMKLARAAKKAANEATEPLLKASDNTVVRALAVAQRAI